MVRNSAEYHTINDRFFVTCYLGQDKFLVMKDRLGYYEISQNKVEVS